MFELVSESFKSAINKLRFVDDEKALKNALETLKKALLKADVHHKVTKELLTLIEEDVKQNGIGQKQFLNAIKINLENILSVNGKNQGFVFTSKPPTVVLMVGLQGGGKTTSTIKLANYLKLRNIPRTIATMSEKVNVDFFIQGFHLEKWFDLDKIVYDNGKIPGKPAPDIYEIAAENIGLPPAECIVVEDAVSGIAAAKNAGAGKIIAIGPEENHNFLMSLDGVSETITNFYEFNREVFYENN